MRVLECSTGNAGIACAFAAAVKGYRCTIVMPEGMSEEAKEVWARVMETAAADTILAQTPGHLFGYMVLGTVARFRKDNAGLSRAYAGFLKRYDAEMKLNRPEYGEHRTSLDDFRKAALDAK